MDNLIKRLQDEADLTEDQAVKALVVVKDFMDKENLDIDWEKFFKGKYQDFSDKAKSLFDNVSDKTQEYTNKLSDKAEDLATQAKRTARDLSEKASHLFNDDDK